MKNTIVRLVATFGLSLGTMAASVPASATVKFAARPLMAVASSVPSRFPTKCPPAAPVGKALGLHVTGPTVVSHVAGLALECQYTSGKGKSTLTWENETQAGFVSQEKALGVKPITGLGKGVLAYSVVSYTLFVHKGALECVIEAYGASFVHIEALAELVLSSYW